MKNNISINLTTISRPFRKLYTSAICALIVLSIPKIVIADSSDYGGGWATPSLETATSIINDVRNREMIDRIVLKNSRSTNSSNRKDKSSSQRPLLLTGQQRISLEFQPSPKLRRQNISKFLVKFRATNPKGSGQITSTDEVIKQIDKSMAAIGLKSNNVADAYAVYWTNAWLGARGRSDDLPQSQMIAVRNQAAAALLATPQFASATNAQKQEMAEAMILQAVLISGVINQAKADPTVMPKVKVAIAQGAKGMGLNLDRMTLTSQGFRSANK